MEEKKLVCGEQLLEPGAEQVSAMWWVLLDAACAARGWSVGVGVVEEHEELELQDNHGSKQEIK